MSSAIGKNCLICCSEETEKLSPEIDTSFSNSEGILFVLRKVFQLSTEQLSDSHLLKDGRESLRVPRSPHGCPSEEESSEVGLCGACRLEIEKAKLIYQLLFVAVRQLREIQQRLVEKLKGGEGGKGSRHGGTVKSTESWRRLAIQNTYKPSRPFVIDDSDVLEQGSLSTNLDIKEEVDAYQNDDQMKEDHSVSFEHLEDFMHEQHSSRPPVNRLVIRVTKLKPEVDDNDSTPIFHGNNDKGDINAPSEDESENVEQEDEEDTSWSPAEGAHVSGESDDDSNEEQEDESDGDEEDLTKDDASSSKQTGLKCDECDFTSKTKRGLRIHMAARHQVPGDYSRKVPSEASKLVKPLPEHKYKCPEEGCGKSFPRRYLYRVHVSKHTQLPTYKCSVCSEEFYESSKLRKHERKQHPESFPSKPEQSFPCDLCCKIMPSLTGLKNHQRLSHNVKPQKGRQCPEEGCDKIVSGTWQLKEHLYKCHGGEPYFKCSECDSAFPTWKKKWRHEQMVHQEGLTKRPFICELCGMRFTCREYLHSHRNAHHSNSRTSKSPNHAGSAGVSDNEKPFICELCGKELKNSNSFKAHMLQVHEKHKLRFVCHVCEGRYISRGVLKAHLFSSHKIGPEENRRKPMKGPVFQCQVTGCRKRFYEDKRKLDRHMKKVHGEDGSKPGKLRCKYCGKEFFDATKYKYHVMTHENKDSKPFVCDVCQKGFTNPVNLRFHRRYTHKIMESIGRGRRPTRANKAVNVNSSEGGNRPDHQ